MYREKHGAIIDVQNKWDCKKTQFSLQWQKGVCQWTSIYCSTLKCQQQEVRPVFIRCNSQFPWQIQLCIYLKKKTFAMQFLAHQHKEKKSYNDS